MSKKIYPTISIKDTHKTHGVMVRPVFNFPMLSVFKIVLVKNIPIQFKEKVLTDTIKRLLDELVKDMKIPETVIEISNTFELGGRAEKKWGIEFYILRQVKYHFIKEHKIPASNIIIKHIKSSKTDPTNIRFEIGEEKAEFKSIPKDSIQITLLKRKTLKMTSKRKIKDEINRKKVKQGVSK